MKSWKKRWKSELNSVIPELSDKVLSASVEGQETSQNVSTSYYSRRRYFKYGALGLAFVFVFTLIITVFLIQPISLPETVFAVEINPAAAFVMDGDGKVKSVKSLNSDADVILSSEEDMKNIIGKSVEVAVKSFVDSAARYGYIDLEDFAAVKLSTTDTERIKNVHSAVEDYLLKKGVRAFVYVKGVSESEFCGLLGVQETADNSLLQTFEKLPAMFAERTVNEKSLEELKYEINNYITKLLSDLSSVDGLDALFGILSAIMETDVETVEDYLEKIGRGLNIEKQIRYAENLFDYEIVRAEISVEENSKWLNEYLNGRSYAELWDDLNKNGLT